MQVEPTALPGVVRITPRRFGDARGWFSESWNRRTLADAGLTLPEFVQDNHSVSAARGTVRGLHYQAPPHAQGKLVRCGRGRLLDVAVDARRGSPTYGHWVAEELSDQNGRQLWIPAGFLHGFVTLEPESEIVYKCSDYYAPASEGALRWDDPGVGIDWPLSGEAILSEKDAEAPCLDDLDSPFEWKDAT